VRIVCAWFVITCLSGTAVASPSAPDSTHHDPHAVITARVGATPWIDLGPSTIFVERTEHTSRSDHKLAAALTLGGLYAAFTTWTYFAWYRKHKPLSEYNWACFLCEGGDGNAKLWSSSGWFGSHRYAGGADKLGHAWATMGLARGGTELLYQWGGYSKRTAALVGTGLSEALFLGVEIKDGAYYEFSFGDLTFNTLGAGLALALSLWPRLDELIDFRVQYYPSDDYVDGINHAPPTDCVAGDPRQICHYHSNLNIAEDYSGETYLLALHLGGIHRLRDAGAYGTVARFVDVVAGFGTRGYKPEPPDGAHREKQEMFLGLSLNAQGLLDYLLDGRANGLRKVTHGFFEVWNVPFTAVPVLDHTQKPVGGIDPGGA
jgi:predicted lipoprotein DUF2279